MKKLFSTPHAMERRIDRYLRDYTNKKGYDEILKRAFLRIAKQHEDQLLHNRNCTGSIFWLKSNVFCGKDKWVEDEDKKPDTEIKIIFKTTGPNQIDMTKI
jgi:hypothetical protein